MEGEERALAWKSGARDIDSFPERLPSTGQPLAALGREPGDYEGGELLLGEGDAAMPIKLPARALVCYPTGLLHQVRPVRSGQRLVMVGWMQSIVRDPGCRELLHELRATTDALTGRDDVAEQVATLSRVYGGLLRRWAFD